MFVSLLAQATTDGKSCRFGSASGAMRDLRENKISVRYGCRLHTPYAGLVQLGE